MISTFGAADDPAILLIGGASSSMDWWPPEFCTSLTGRYVIRYDHRDTGDAPSYPPGEPGYTGEDLVTDAVAVLDELGVASAHVVGISMGGALAQVMALDQPTRVRSLTAIATTASAGDDDLPGMAPEVASAFGALSEPDWTDHDAVVSYLVASQRILSAEPFDEADTREIASIAVARTKNIESSQRNHHATKGGRNSWRHRLPEIAVPTLVLHGDRDPLFPLPHGEALASEIRGARLVVLPNTGHEFPRRVWPQVVPLLLDLTSGG
ncbi:alpha/beta fold hydrolase [Actinophytocola oryzae]|uniref:Pimeloyl-ACP methyl ester carboxylesterase n=1 Tax=Actinophytocola oryzae TaxID=502181 RepID=A0A4R7V2Q2_9PSEU|nr:alpha/beta hydrolase [Actinophytocola oryzae]TDV41726.1 pimeloyl-ACP methyl ester carboxylesterase [Actinophytocola oryzae]